MARLYRDLCDIINAIPNVNFATECDPAAMRFSLVEKDTPPDTNTTTSPSNTVAASHDGGVIEDSNDHHSGDNTEANLNSEDQKEEDGGDLDGVSSGGEDMEGYESDTSGSSSSSSSGEDVVVEGYGDSGEEGEERLTEEGEGEEEAMVTASIQQLKVSSIQCSSIAQKYGSLFRWIQLMLTTCTCMVTSYVDASVDVMCTEDKTRKSSLTVLAYVHVYSRIVSLHSC